MDQESENTIEENFNPEVIPKIIEEKPKMNKKYLIILNIVVLVVVVLGIFYILKPSEPDFSQIGKCGDGVCDEDEKSDLKICPQDCKSIQIKCQNFPPPNFCPNGPKDVVVIDTDENGCSIYGCSNNGEVEEDSSGRVIISPPDKGMYLGQNHSKTEKYSGLTSDVEVFENAIGKKVALFWKGEVMSGQETKPGDNDNGGILRFDVTEAKKAWDNGYLVMAGAYEPHPPNGPLVDELLNGDYDKELESLAEQFAEFGKPMFFSTVREPNAVLAEYMGGFGPDGTENRAWASESGNSGYNNFDPSIFPNSELYKGLGDDTYCDGAERFAAAQRYYYNFFVTERGLDLTFDTNGWSTPFFNENEFLADGNIKGGKLYNLSKNCNDFELYYPLIKNYSDWISINWYYLFSGTEDLTVYEDIFDTALASISKMDPDKPILITELGFCDAFKNEGRKEEKVRSGLAKLLEPGSSQIKAFTLWYSWPEDREHFPYDCQIRPETDYGDAFEEIVNANSDKFNSCAKFSDGTTISNCDSNIFTQINLDDFE